MLSLIPISDANPTRRRAVVTLALIALNIFAFFFVEPDFGTSVASEVYFVQHAPLPCQLQDACPVAVSIGAGLVGVPERNLPSFIGSIVLSAFLHGGFLHIAGNMLFLWIFGNNVEDHLGRGRYLLFYLLGGIAAGLTQVLSHLGGCRELTQAPCQPAVGASGAVAAIMGAYFVLFPHARVNVLVPIFLFFTVVRMSAWVVLGLWVVFQVVVPQPGVAWEAHIGGFVFGVVAILLLGGRPQRPRPVAWYPEWR